MLVCGVEDASEFFNVSGEMRRIVNIELGVSKVSLLAAAQMHTAGTSEKSNPVRQLGMRFYQAHRSSCHLQGASSIRSLDVGR